MKIKIRSRQTLADLAIQLYGSIEGVFTLAQENDLEITDTLQPGSELEYDPAHTRQKWVASHFQTKEIYPSTAHTGSTDGRIFDRTFDQSFE